MRGLSRYITSIQRCRQRQIDSTSIQLHSKHHARMRINARIRLNARVNFLRVNACVHMHVDTRALESLSFHLSLSLSLSVTHTIFIHRSI